MKKATFLDRLKSCLPILDRCDISNFTERFAQFEAASGVEISKATRWLKALERACVEEAMVYKDMSPTAWQNLAMLHPGSNDIKRLRKLRTLVRRAWKA